jgi:hypothetical protein
VRNPSPSLVFRINKNRINKKKEAKTQGLRLPGWGVAIKFSAVQELPPG